MSDKEQTDNQPVSISEQIEYVIDYFNRSLEPNGFKLNIYHHTSTENIYYHDINLICPPTHGVSLCSSIAYDVMNYIKANVNLSDVDLVILTFVVGYVLIKMEV